MPIDRKIPLAALALIGALVACALPLSSARAAGASAAVHYDGTDPGSGPLDLAAAQLVQRGTDLVIRVRTHAPWLASDLTTHPGSSLCVGLGSRALVCVQPGERLTLARRTAAGLPAQPHPLPGGSFTRHDAEDLRIDLPVTAAGLRPGPLRWSVQSAWTGTGCPTAPASACVDRLPDQGALGATIAPTRPVGCVARPGKYTNGSRARRVVALTFDDGPWPDTPGFLNVLERERVSATFFMIGRQVAGHGALLARMLRDGDIIGDHTWDHADVASGGPFAAAEISRTAAAIARTSGFHPCLFRPPGGASSPALVATAAAQHFATITWDVDPSDWSRPGTGAIYSRLVGAARPGSILLMHDGGGNRSETLAALPAVIHTLRARGYGFTTVTDLLGFRILRG